MNKRIIASLAMIALVIAGVTSATVAYFSKAVFVSENTFAMGTVDVINAGGLPFMFTNMIPGEQRVSDIITIQNTGSIPIDLYVGQRAENGDNFIGVVDYAINEVTCWEGNYVGTWVNWQDVELLFSTWNKVGENIPTGYKCYKVYVMPDLNMDNDLQGAEAITDVIIYAVQAGTPAPSGEPWDWSED